MPERSNKARSSVPAAFLHARHVTVDGRIAVVGSVDIDIRSFELDREISQLTAAEWNRRPLLARVAENTARVAETPL